MSATISAAPVEVRPPAVRRRRVSAGRLLQRYWYGWAMVAPIVLVLALLVVYPLGKGLWLSMTNATELNSARNIGANHIKATYHGVGWDNYVNVLSGEDGNFYPRLVWTLEWTGIGVFLHYTIGLGLAVLLNRTMRFRAAYRLLLILPWGIPAFVAAFSWRLILNGDGGVLNAVLHGVGLQGQDWLSQPTTAKIAVIGVNVWLGVPFMMVALLGGMQSVPRDLYEAAEMDGASAWQRFREVTMPGLRPVSGTVLLLGIIWTFNQFPVIALVTGGGPGGATDILVTQAYNEAFQGVGNYAGAATYGAIILSMLLVFSVFYRRLVQRATGEAAL